MKDNFTQSLRAVLRDEGGNDDDPDDPGGRTSRGITQSEYSKYRVKKNLKYRDVWKADDSEIEEIYHDKYWLPYCDDFPRGIDYAYFDAAVNTGTRQAALFLQRAAGVPDDGHIGPITKAVVGQAQAEPFIRKFSDFKRHFYRNLNKPKYLKGWLARVDRVETIALAMAELDI